MNDMQHNLSQQIVRGGLALVTVAALSAGVTWRVFAAPQTSASTSAPQAAVSAPAPTIGHAIAGGRDSYADVVNVVAPAVVTIRVEGKAQMVPTQFGSQDPEDLFRRFFGENGPAQRRVPREFKQRGLGSGVIVSADGYILTNHHVIDGADSIRVELTDGRQLDGKVVGSDEPSDLALVKIEATGLKALTLGNSDNVQVGDVVLAVGNPLGIGQTVTMGIISAKGRSTAARGESYEDFLQTDAPINQGNSGGALVSTRGELVGINSQIASMTGGNIGIGFAIPANMARHVMNDLKSGGHVRRAQLGVGIQDVTPEIAASLGEKDLQGVIVSSVTPDSAADRAGLKQGDVITAFNGEKVRDGNVLKNHVADSTPGSTASLAIVRDGKPQTLSVKLDEKQAEREASARGATSDRDDKAALGINVAPLTPELAARVGLPRTAKGVFVQDLDPNGRAADAGLERGDVIEQVNRQTVQTVDELRAAVRRSSDRPVLLLVTREGKSIYVTVKPS